MNFKNLLDELHEKARTRGHQYGFLLLRVIGIEYFADGDPLILLNANLQADTATKEQIDSSKDFWAYLINLDVIANNQDYSPYPIPASPEVASFYDIAVPQLTEDLRAAVTEARENNTFIGLSKYLLEGYVKAINEFFSVNPRYMRDPYFTVTEFYADEKGLGFIAHHSNGTSSTFFRTGYNTQSVNLISDDSIGFFVGDTSQLRSEWLVNGEPMYKTKFHGKYNEDGEWKPIVYTGDSSIPQNEALSFSENEQAQGVFFYMYTTGFPVVEFTLKTKIELPEHKTIFKNGVNLYRVDTGNDDLKNEYIYDGWMRFEDLSEKGVLEAIDVIMLTIQGLTFAFETETTWQLKYSLHSHTRGLSTPTDKDLQQTVDLISKIEESKDKDNLVAAISWFNLGSKSDNPIIAFVCFYTAVEALARQLSDGKLDASTFYKTKTTKVSESDKLSEYDNLYKKHYPKNLTKLLSEGYFDIHISLGRAMKNAFASTYGEEHAAYKRMFGKNGLVGLRGSIVHESYSEWDRKQYENALKHLHEIHDIAYSFINRIALQIPKDQKIPTMSLKFKMSMDASHPSTTLAVSSLKHLPNKSWKIRPEWI